MVKINELNKKTLVALDMYDALETIDSNFNAEMETGSTTVNVIKTEVGSDCVIIDAKLEYEMSFCENDGYRDTDKFYNDFNKYISNIEKNWDDFRVMLIKDMEILEDSCDAWIDGRFNEEHIVGEFNAYSIIRIVKDFKEIKNEKN